VYFVMPEFPQTDAHNRVLNLGLPPEAVVLAGSAALETVVGPDVRRAADLDLAVTPEVYAYMRDQPEMQEVTAASGYVSLIGNGLDISVGWGGQSVEQLQQAGYVKDGVHVAGLPDVYALKQNRGLEKDVRDLQIIRDRVYGNEPLPLGMLGGELQFVNSCVAERLHGHPALHVAANGLYIVRTLFGHEDGLVRSYGGSVEQAVPATYHAWKHSAYGVRDGQRNMDQIDDEQVAAGLPPQFTDTDRLAQAQFANHDVVLGHGRRAANPTAHDERQAAELTVRHLEAVGCGEDTPLLEKSHAGIIVTTFNEATKGQDIDPARGHMAVQEVNAGSDMSAFRRPDGYAFSIRLAVEDLCRTGAGYDEPLSRLVTHINSSLPEGVSPVVIRSMEDGLQLIDKYPNFMVTKITADGPQTMTLREAFATHLDGSGKFCAGYKFPASWQLGSATVQAENALRLTTAATAVQNGASATSLYRDAL
jgi:hypothetical protein